MFSDSKQVICYCETWLMCYLSLPVRCCSSMDKYCNSLSPVGRHSVKLKLLGLTRIFSSVHSLHVLRVFVTKYFQ